MAEAKRIINAKYMAVCICFFLIAIFTFLKGQYDKAADYEYTSDYDSYTKAEILKITGAKYKEYLEKLENGEDILEEDVLGGDISKEDTLSEENFEAASWENDRQSVEKSIERNVLYELKSQSEYMEEYKNKYADMKSYADSMAGVSIFNNSTGFAKRNSDKTIEAYKNVADTELQYGNDTWIKALTEYKLADYLLLILIIYMIMQFGIEQKSNLIYFIRSAKEGRGKLAACRCILLTVFTIISVLVFYGAVLICSSVVNNVKFDFTRSIQSIAIFENCIFKINVGQFLILFFAIKAIVLILLSFLIWNILGGIREKKFGMVFLGVFFAVEYIMYIFIGDSSRMNYFKYINIFYYLDTKNLIGGYKNLNIISYPINSFKIFVVLVPVLILVLAAVCIYKNINSYGSNGNKYMSLKKHIEALRIKLSPVVDRIAVFRGEAIKIFFIMGGLAVAAVFLYIGYTRIDNEPLAKGQEGKIKEFYYNELAGEYNEEMSKKINMYILETEEEYNEIMESILELSDEERMIHMMKADSLQQKLSVLNDINSEIMYLGELKSERGITGSLYNPNGVNYLFGGVSADLSLVNAIIICSFICIFSGGVYSYEKKSNMLKFISSTKEGRRKTKSVKLLMCELCSCIYALIISVIEYTNVMGKVGIDGLSGAIQSVSFFREFPFEISLGTFIIFTYALRILTVISVTAVAVCISKYVSKIIAGQLAGLGVICMPLILYYMGVDIMKYAAIGRGIAVSDFIWNNGSFDVSIIIQSGIIAVIGVAAVIIYMKDNKN